MTVLYKFYSYANNAHIKKVNHQTWVSINLIKNIHCIQHVLSNTLVKHKGIFILTEDKFQLKHDIFTYLSRTVYISNFSTNNIE